MKSHRGVPKTSQNRTFEAGFALEHLRAEMIDVEALARAADAVADALPTRITERQRLVFGQIQSLAAKTSQQASASLRFANTHVAAFTGQMSADRSTTE